MKCIFVPPYKASHSHWCMLETLEAEGHFHVINKITKPANGDAYDGHIHYFSGVTTLDEGHYHRLYGKTGPAIPRSDGSHYHEVYGVTYRNYVSPQGGARGGAVYSSTPQKTHKHAFGGNTSNPVGIDV